MQLSIEAVRDLARLLRESGLQQISFKDIDDATGEPFRISLKSGPPPGRTRDAQPAPLSESGPRPAVANAIAPHDEGALPLPTPDTLLKATAVGVFWQMSPPLQAGAAVKAGQVVAIVESLKIPNEIIVPRDGRVSQVLVEDGQGVEYGQPLLSIAPDGGHGGQSA